MTLNGAVTGVDVDTPTNKPVAGAKVEIYAVDPDTGVRKGAALLTKTTGVGRRLGAAADGQRHGAGVRRRRAGQPRHAHLPLAFPALVRPAEPAPGTRQRGRRQRRRHRDHEPAARLFRLAARRHADRRQDARRHPAGRARDMAAAGQVRRRSRTGLSSASSTRSASSRACGR